MSTWYPYDTYGAFPYPPGLRDDPAQRSQGRIAIVGLPGAGKKTLLNSLWGWEAVYGNHETVRSFGLFTLVDLPTEGYDAANALLRLESADLILYVLDSRAGLTGDSFNWLARLRSLDAALLVLLNCPDGPPPADALRQLEDRLARPVLTLSVADSVSIHERLIPALLKACPALAVPLANEMVALRASVARHVALQSALECLSAGLEAGSIPDHAPHLDIQKRMLRQIAAIYGYQSRERTEISGALRRVLDYGLALSDHLQGLDNRVRPGVISAGMTLTLGYLAILVYGGYLPLWLQRFTPLVGGGHYGRDRSGVV
jgi:hypothetical protein